MVFSIKVCYLAVNRLYLLVELGGAGSVFRLVNSLIRVIQLGLITCIVDVKDLYFSFLDRLKNLCYTIYEPNGSYIS